MGKEMCGRVIQKTPLGEIRVLFETINAVPNSAPNFNGAPTQLLPVVRLDEEGRRSLDLLRWGLIPFWAKDPAISMRCCLVPVDGFYEWQKRPAGKKQPYAIVSADGKPFAMAGLWENWKEPQSGETVRTFTIITGPPNELVAPIHNRMPVILPSAHWHAWLDEEPVPAEELQALLQPYPAELMRAYPVDVRVGNVRNNDAALIEPVALAS
jgi:putative SOS response-associated peptidase YedK